jgi:hypothetical protein
MSIPVWFKLLLTDTTRERHHFLYKADAVKNSERRRHADGVAKLRGIGASSSPRRAY